MARDWGSRLSTTVRFVVLAVMIGFYGWLHIAFINERNVACTLEEHGILASAKVVSSGKKSGGFRNHAQLIEYEYEVDNQLYAGSEVIWQGTPTAGAKVSIRYNGSAPTTSRLSQSDKLQTLLWAVIIFDLMLGSVGIAIFKEQRGGKRLR